MPFDFGKVARTGAISQIVDPSTLFDALPNKAQGYGYLRAVQKTVLDAWSERRDERDLVIKTNTGGGKTIVGLLMLQCSLHEKRGPALYLAPDPHLAARVRVEAGNLGLAVVDDPTSTRFLSGDAICVTTMAVLVNGMTRFGLADDGSRPPIPVGSIVIDDAHAALALTEEHTRLHIPSGHKAYGELLDLFEDDLRTQGVNTLKDIQEQDRSAVLRVPFWAWQDRHDDVLTILRPHRKDEIFKWSWPLLKDLIPLCQAVVTTDGFEIMPPCPPIEKIPSFAEAGRRIYLTATLADDSVLVTHFGADADSVAQSLVPESAADLGDRLVLAPQELIPNVSHDEIRGLVRSIADERNVVVLVPSWRAARQWAREADVTAATADDIGAAVEALRASHVGLAVFVNRYDGIDLPDDACRLLVIDSLPFAYTGIERRETVALRDSQAMITRQLQRLEQGMGRGVRSRDDRCAVLVLGPRLTQLTARADLADRMSAATRAQLDLSRRVAAQLAEGIDIDSLRAVIMQVIDADPEFRKLSREVLVGIGYEPAVVSPTAPLLRAAYDAAAAGRLAEAADAAGAAVQAAMEDGDTRLAGWLGETHAAYLHGSDRVAAQVALAHAAALNSAVLRPLAGLEYRHVEEGSPQADKAVEVYQCLYSTAAELLLGFDALLADIQWDPERTDEAETALADLGTHLGLASQMPEREFGEGSDVLWALGDTTYGVIEAKTGATAGLIWKRDANQLAGSVNWCQERYGEGATVIPVLVHPARDVERAATAPAGTRVVTTAKLKGLKGAVHQYARAIAREDQFRDPVAVGARLKEFDLLASQLLVAFAEPTRREPPKSR